MDKKETLEKCYTVIEKGCNLGFWNTEYGFTHLVFKSKKDAEKMIEKREKLLNTSSKLRIIPCTIIYG